MSDKRFPWTVPCEDSFGRTSSIGVGVDEGQVILHTPAEGSRLSPHEFGLLLLALKSAELALAEHEARGES